MIATGRQNSYLQYLNALLHCRIEINMVGSDPSSDADLEVLGLSSSISGILTDMKS